MSQERFCEGADSLGNIAVPIAREGQLIAGRCRWPKLESEPILKPDECLDWRSGAMIRIAFASDNLAKAIDIVRTRSARTELGEFVAASSDAAERFAKIAFGKLASGTGVDIQRGHQVNEIVKAIDRVLERNAGPSAAWWRSGRGMKVQDLLCTMNGHGHEDRQSGYPESTLDAEVIARAANRLIATVSFAVLEVEDLPNSEDLRQAAKEVSSSYWTSMQESSSRLRRVLQDLDPSNLTYASASSTFAESVSVAVSSGERIAQALEKLAESLCKRNAGLRAVPKPCRLLPSRMSAGRQAPRKSCLVRDDEYPAFIRQSAHLSGLNLSRISPERLRGRRQVFSASA